MRVAANCAPIVHFTRKSSKLLTTLTYGVRPYDAVVLIAAVSTVVAIAAVATWLPARRATAVNPADALSAD